MNPTEISFAGNDVEPRDWFRNTKSPFSLYEKFRILLWRILEVLIFRPSPHPMNRLRVGLLRMFGAEVGFGCFINRKAKIWLPWNLKVGDHTGIGFDVLIYNFERVSIGSFCSISPRAFINTASHDYKDPTFSYITKPVTIDDGAFVGADVYINPGMRIGKMSVVAARSVVLHDTPAYMVCGGYPCKPIKRRFD